MRSPVTLREGEELPEICSSCGEPTRRRKKLHFRRQDRPDSDHDAALAVMGMASVLFGLLALFARSSPGVAIDVWLPQCRSCARAKGQPEPQHISWETHEVTFLVHRAFRRELANLRENPPSA